MDVSQTLYCGHYNNKQQILLVGEGDFSFSLCLARAFGSSTNITATSLDTRDELGLKYKDAKNNVEELERLGCTVVHGVNVHSMNTDYRVVRSDLYDRIIINFPHQEVVRGFLRSGKEMVKDFTGDIHVTHKTAYPFASWNIKDLGSEIGLFNRKMEFEPLQYPGYSNKRGSGSDYDSSFPVGEFSTFMFRKQWFSC
ncbi:uncharacterized protein At4g26485-like [Arabidopsis lyrata subsp. lyrata]|uniref:uncharacterized protein At4g26485-like n=1 Tax=Arabidopsis lyrata subsp. lyrata TaxID=81972 RepID=UPI000A29E7DB|nr:uncharacterized protein At4g26485-like [Arabidopsis lyrata subsp. lyrata]|eukprot:XP_020866247.1 uncharacterized protein At4g26485-like [Arabidopsis lyrata subsp. lyrata]